MVDMGDDGDIANRCRHEFNGIPAAKRNGLQVRSCGPSELQSRICGSNKRTDILPRTTRTRYLAAPVKMRIRHGMSGRKPHPFQVHDSWGLAVALWQFSVSVDATFPAKQGSFPGHDFDWEYAQSNSGRRLFSVTRVVAPVSLQG